MHQLAQHLAILRKTTTLQYRESLFDNTISRKITVHKIRHVSSKDDIQKNETYCTQLILQFSAIVGFTSSAYLLKDTTDQLYLIPFKELSREEAHRLLIEPFQLTLDENGNNPQFISDTSLKVLAAKAQVPDATLYANFNDWECGRKYLIEQDITTPGVDKEIPSRITLRYITSVGYIQVFEVEQVSGGTRRPMQGIYLPYGKEIITSLTLSSLLLPTAKITPCFEIQPYGNFAIQQRVYSSVTKQMLTSPEYVSQTYPKFNLENFVTATPNDVSWKQLHQSGIMRTNYYHVLTARYGMDEFTLIVTEENNKSQGIGEDISIIVTLELSDLTVSAALNLLQQLQNNAASNTDVAHNLNLAQSSFTDELHEDIADLIEMVNLHPTTEQNGKDTTLLKEFAIEHGVRTSYDIYAAALKKQKVINFYNSVLKDVTFKVHHAGNFMFV